MTIRGTLKIYKKDLQMTALGIKRVLDPNFETLWINKTIYEKRLRDGVPNRTEIEPDHEPDPMDKIIMDSIGRQLDELNFATG